MVKLQQVGKRYFLNIPLDKIKRLKLEKGTEFDVECDAVRGDLIFRRI